MTEKDKYEQLNIREFIREELNFGDKYIVEAHAMGYDEGWNECIDFICERLAGDPLVLYEYKRYDKNSI